MISILMAEAERHVRDALRIKFANQSELSLMGEAPTSESLVAQVCQHPPDVILLDWCLPGLHPQRLLPVLRECCPEAIIVAISVQPEHESIARKFDVDAFLSKQLPPDEFIDGLKEAINKNASDCTETP